ncbi:hypothetical protein CHUAL_008577 [Chamberlinius hualienensis]
MDIQMDEVAIEIEENEAEVMDEIMAEEDEDMEEMVVEEVPIDHPLSVNLSDYEKVLLKLSHGDDGSQATVSVEHLSSCFQLEEDGLIRLIATSRNLIVDLNLNNCYWLSKETISKVATLPKLKHLKVIGCKVSGLTKTFPNKLESLSITFCSCWDVALQNEEYALNIFKNMKKLVIAIPPMETCEMFTKLANLVLNHCSELQSLSLIDSYNPNCHQSLIYFSTIKDDRNNWQDASQYKVSLPKLEMLTVNLGSYMKSVPEIFENWLSMLLDDLTGSLKFIDLGIWSYHFFVKKVDIMRKLVEKLPLDKSNLIKVDHYCLSRVGDVQEFLTTLRTKSIKCQKVSMNFTKFNFKTLTEVLINIGYDLNSLSLQGCIIYAPNFLIDFDKIALYCLNLVSLDLTSSNFIGIDGFESLWRIIAKMSNLKSLSVPVSFIGEPFDENGPNERLEIDQDITDAKMRNCWLWKVTQGCVDLEEFKVFNFELLDQNCLLVSEILLSCISKWSKLRVLHLSNIYTRGRGKFLPIIMSGCQDLTSLTVGTLRLENGMKSYLISALMHGLTLNTNIRELRILERFGLSEGMCEILLKCHNLERIYLSEITIKKKCVFHVQEMLEKLPNLVGVFWLVKDGERWQIVQKIKETLSSLKERRPKLFYVCESTAPNYPIKIPDIHLDFILTASRERPNCAFMILNPNKR